MGGRESASAWRKPAERKREKLAAFSDAQGQFRWIRFPIGSDGSEQIAQHLCPPCVTLNAKRTDLSQTAACPI
jgi:hypothetical protein